MVSGGLPNASRRLRRPNLAKQSPARLVKDDDENMVVRDDNENMVVKDDDGTPQLVRSAVRADGWQVPTL